MTTEVRHFIKAIDGVEQESILCISNRYINNLFQSKSRSYWLYQCSATFMNENCASNSKVTEKGLRENVILRLLIHSMTYAICVWITNV